jgi:hypothetical protein
VTGKRAQLGSDWEKQHCWEVTGKNTNAEKKLGKTELLGRDWEKQH